MLPAVQTAGLAKFRRDLKRLAPEVDKELRNELKGAAEKVRERAAAAAPRRTGALAESLRVSITTRGASIYSRLPYAPVVHWGGTISPRGTPISIARTEFISRAAEDYADELVDDVGDGVDRAARRVGWR